MFTARAIPVPPPTEPPEDRLFGERHDAPAAHEPTHRPADEPIDRPFDEPIHHPADAPADVPAGDRWSDGDVPDQPLFGTPPPPPGAPEPAPPWSPEPVPDVAPTVADPAEATASVTDLADELSRYVVEDAVDGPWSEAALPGARPAPAPAAGPEVTPPAQPEATPPAEPEATRPPAEPPVPATPVAAPEAAPADTGATEGVRVHDHRLDRRPGPIRLSPSEAVALAKDGPAALHRRRPRGA